MEQILSKLSEIELAARHIMEDADRTKKALSEEAEKKCRDFDHELEKSTSQKVLQIRSSLEKEKDSQLTALRQNTEDYFRSLDSYFEENHERLAEELFHKLLES